MRLLALVVLVTVRIFGGVTSIAFGVIFTAVSPVHGAAVSDCDCLAAVVQVV